MAARGGRRSRGSQPAGGPRRASAVQPPGGPGGTERLLARVALEWAARIDAAGHRSPVRAAALGLDRGRRPAAPIPLATALLDEAQRAGAAHRHRRRSCRAVPRRCPPARRPPSSSATASRTRRGAAAQVLVACRARRDAGGADRAGPRAGAPRARAARARRASCMRDETGWRLVDDARRRGRDGAAAAPRVRDASADAWLDWLKSAPIGRRPQRRARSARSGVAQAPGRATRAAWPRLDARRGGQRPCATMPARCVDALARSPRRLLVEWLDALAGALDRCRRARPPARRRRRPAGARGPGHRSAARAPSDARSSPPTSSR